MNRALSHPARASLPLMMLLLALSTALSFTTIAHEGEDHGTPVAVATAETNGLFLSSSDSGSLFEAILKYHPFNPGEGVEVMVYLLSLEANRPISNATVSASLSEGSQSATVIFVPKPGGPVGAYQATVTPKTAAPMSWLFDVTADGNADLIAITGFQARSPESSAGVESIPHTSPPSSKTPWPVLGIGAIGVLALVAAFIAGRLTARKAVSV